MSGAPRAAHPDSLASPQWTYLLAGVGGGVVSGLFGVGGGIVLVPLLTMVFHFSQKRAHATSLVAIVLTAISGTVSYVIAGQVLVVPALAIAVGGVGGSFVGAWILHRLSEDQVRIVFAVVIVLVALKMVLTTAAGGGESLDLSVAAVAGLLTAGLAMGTLSALVGVGGGIILVPILVVVLGFVPTVAQGTSLLVMIPVALMGAARNATHGYTDWRVGVVVGLGGVIGSPAGAWTALSLPAVWMQRLFAALLVVCAVQLLFKVRSSRHEV